MKSIILVVAIATLHFFVGFWLFTKSFGHVFSAFDTGKELTLIEQINYYLVEIFFFPIVTIVEATKYDGENIIAQYLPFILNSVLWGILIVFAWNKISRIYKKV